MSRLKVERHIWIDAPRERVWDALTDPVQIEQWFSPGTPWTLSALAVGGRLFVYDNETQTEMYTQIIEKLDPPHEMVLRSEVEPTDTPATTTYTLQEEKGGTRLLIMHSGYEGLPEETRQQRLLQDEEGFTMMLGNIKAVVEKTSLPRPSGF